MARAAEILGVRHAWLGFADSGYPEGDPLPPLPEGCFAALPVEDTIEPLVRLIREFRPQVVTTYDENGGYPHPDHVRTHETTMAAIDAAADAGRFPGARRAVAGAEDLLQPAVQQGARRGAAPGDDRRRPGLAVPRLDQELGGPARGRSAHHDPDPRGRLVRGARPGAAGPPHPDRTRTACGSRCRWPSSARSGRPRTSNSPDRSSRHACRRTTCSPAYGRTPHDQPVDGCAPARHLGRTRPRGRGPRRRAEGPHRRRRTGRRCCSLSSSGWPCTSCGAR